MNATSSRQQILLGTMALALAWAPAAMIAAPGANGPAALVVEAAAQEEAPEAPAAPLDSARTRG